MGFENLTGTELLHAIQVFVAHAYASGEVPENRRQFAEIPETATLAEILATKGVERLRGQFGENEPGYAFRIGRIGYPHMKMLLRSYGQPPGYLFAVETHDQLRVPPTIPEADEIRALQRRNHELAREIEQAWEARGIPTQGYLLRRYLEKAQKEIVGSGRN